MFYCILIHDSKDSSYLPDDISNVGQLLGLQLMDACH